LSQKNNPLTTVVFFICAAGIAAFAILSLGTGLSFMPGWQSDDARTPERHRTRVITPGVMGNSDPDSSWDGYNDYEGGYNLKVPLNDGEIVISALYFDLETNVAEEQVVAFYNLNGGEAPVAITFISYNEQDGSYWRLWNAPAAATMPGTVTMYSRDMLGDRSICIIVTGMNAIGEHTMTIFHRYDVEKNQPFKKIAEIQMDGSITIQESERPLAYRQGITRGQPFSIIAHKPDNESSNILDRIEITYTYNNAKGIYEESIINHVPGSQIEQRRLREILSGRPGVFEEFINDLWYHVSPEGTVDKSQYLYFDPEKHEIIFFGDDTQQIFTWYHSTYTRYGLYISSQNVSVSTLRRFLDIEMVSLDSIRIKVVEDVRLKIDVSMPWDGLYYRAGSAVRAATEEKKMHQYTNAVYDSSMGRLRFSGSGEYELVTGVSITSGRYAFFRVGGKELLELRPEQNGTLGGGGGARSGASRSGASRSGDSEDRLVYSLSGVFTGENDDVYHANNLFLSRVLLGSSGIRELYEGQIVLTKSQ
jgi:hypothetical protein